MPKSKLQEYLEEQGMDVSSLPNKKLVEFIKNTVRDAYMDGTVSNISKSVYGQDLKILEDELFTRLNLLDTYIEEEREMESILSNEVQKMNYRKRGRYS